MLLNKFNLFDRSKLLFTVIIGLMCFFYDVGTIVNPAPMQNNQQLIITNPTHPSSENNNPDTVNEQSENNIVPFTIPDLLSWFDSTQSEEYQNAYRIACEGQSYLCSSIQLQFSDNNKEYYYGLLALVTIHEINNLLLKSDTLQTTLIIKNDPDQKKRWYATKQSIVINIYNLSEEEVFEVLVHELGHTLDLWILQGTDSTLHTKFTEFWEPVFALDDPSIPFYTLSRESEWIKRPWSNITDFCTIYGSQNPFEDFSECFNLYINHHNYFVSLSQTNSILLQKYHFIQSWIRQGNHYKNNTHTYSSDLSYRYRDSTKIPVSTLEITEL